MGLRPTPRLGRLRGPDAPRRSLAGARARRRSAQREQNARQESHNGPTRSPGSRKMTSSEWCLTNFASDSARAGSASSRLSRPQNCWSKRCTAPYSFVFWCFRGASASPNLCESAGGAGDREAALFDGAWSRHWSAPPDWPFDCFRMAGSLLRRRQPSIMASRPTSCRCETAAAGFVLSWPNADGHEFTSMWCLPDPGWNVAKHLFGDQPVAGLVVVADATKWKESEGIAVRLECRIDIDDRDSEAAHERQHIIAFVFSPGAVARITRPLRKVDEIQPAIPLLHS